MDDPPKPLERLFSPVAVEIQDRAVKTKGDRPLEFKLLLSRLSEPQKMVFAAAEWLGRSGGSEEITIEEARRVFDLGDRRLTEVVNILQAVEKGVIVPGVVDEICSGRITIRAANMKVRQRAAVESPEAAS